MRPSGIRRHLICYVVCRASEEPAAPLRCTASCAENSQPKQLFVFLRSNISVLVVFVVVFLALSRTDSNSQRITTEADGRH
jgi:hypothetical protein